MGGLQFDCSTARGNWRTKCVFQSSLLLPSFLFYSSWQLCLFTLFNNSVSYVFVSIHRSGKNWKELSQYFSCSFLRITFCISPEEAGFPSRCVQRGTCASRSEQATSCLVSDQRRQIRRSNFRMRLCDWKYQQPGGSGQFRASYHYAEHETLQ